jgi:hypothetical protein
MEGVVPSIEIAPEPPRQSAPVGEWVPELIPRLDSLHSQVHNERVAVLAAKACHAASVAGAQSGTFVPPRRLGGLLDVYSALAPRSVHKARRFLVVHPLGSAGYECVIANVPLLGITRRRSVVRT